MYVFCVLMYSCKLFDKYINVFDLFIIIYYILILTLLVYFNLKILFIFCSFILCGDEQVTSISINLKLHKYISKYFLLLLKVNKIQIHIFVQSRYHKLNHDKL